MRYRKRVLAVILILALTLQAGIIAGATEETEADVAEETLTPEELQQRASEMPIETNALTGWPQGCATYGEAAIVMEVGSGAILYAKDIDAHHYPASITKILTTLVALENGKLDDTVSISEDCLCFLNWDDAQIGVKTGDELSLDDALHAVLLASANEVSYAVGESVGKSNGHDYAWFIEQMNETCKSLGGENSNFVNPHGLHDDNHYTCARDMALISRELFKYPRAFEIMQTLLYTIEACDTIDEHVVMQNHKMLWQDNGNYYEYVIGGKTGYTDQSLSTLVTMADNGEMQLVCVLLRTYGGNVYPDTRNLLEYTFGNFKKVPVAEKETSEDVRKILNDGYVVLPDGVDFDSLEMEIVPDEEGGEATLCYTYEGNPVGEVRAELTTAYIREHGIKINDEQEVSAKVSDKKENSRKSPALAIAFVILFALIMALVHEVLKQKRAKQRRRRKRRRY